MRFFEKLVVAYFFLGHPVDTVVEMRTTRCLYKLV